MYALFSVLVMYLNTYSNTLVSLRNSHTRKSPYRIQNAFINHLSYSRIQRHCWLRLHYVYRETQLANSIPVRDVDQVTTRSSNCPADDRARRGRRAPAVPLPARSPRAATHQHHCICASAPPAAPARTDPPACSPPPSMLVSCLPAWRELALAAADRPHDLQASSLDPWRLSTPQVHLTKLP